MDRRFLGILAAIVVVMVGVFVITQRSGNNSGNNSSGSSNAQPTNHVLGEGQKGIRLVEYGDFQCPVCDEYSQPLNQVAAQFSKDIYFQFANLPLTQIHQNAFSAARAAEAAGLQGDQKYWAMHDKLYANQATWSESNDAKKLYDQYAKDIGLNLSQFDADYAGSKVNDNINADLAAFKKTGQPMATPTFFLDGKYIDNSNFIDSGQVSVAKIAALINKEIAAKAQ